MWSNLGKRVCCYLGFRTRRWVNVLEILYRVALQKSWNRYKRAWRWSREAMLVDQLSNGRSFTNPRTKVQRCHHHRSPLQVNLLIPRNPPGDAVALVFLFSLARKKTHCFPLSASRTSMAPLLLLWVHRQPVPQTTLRIKIPSALASCLSPRHLPRLYILSRWELSLIRSHPHPLHQQRIPIAQVVATLIGLGHLAFHARVRERVDVLPPGVL